MRNISNFYDIFNKFRHSGHFGGYITQNTNITQGPNLIRVLNCAHRYTLFFSKQDISQIKNLQTSKTEKKRKK